MKTEITKKLIRLTLSATAIVWFSTLAFAQSGYAPRIDYRAIINGDIVVGGNALITCDPATGAKRVV